MSKLKLGVIGMSEGNGHPYSWSAIFNGFNEEYMRNCPFPVIYDYLKKQKFPDDYLVSEAEVTHVFTQDHDLSEHIAKAANIKAVVKNHHEMIGKVDGVLLARDDAESHLKYAYPFLDVGLPIYIDKPLAYNVSDADRVFKLQRFPWQIFTCSALRYSEDLSITEFDKKKLGRITSVVGTTPKSWEKYSIHVIEPILVLLGFPKFKVAGRKKKGDDVELSLTTNDSISIVIQNFKHQSIPISINVIGESMSLDLVFKDSFTAFKNALKAFIKQVRMREPLITKEQTIDVIRVIESGLEL